jgi:V8-like Glu-specific endopeptidase
MVRRPVFELVTSGLILLLMVSALLQGGIAAAGAETGAGSTGDVHHFADAPEAWESRLLDPDSERDLQLIIGVDDRVRVSPTNVRPYQSIAYLEAWDDDQDMAISCTATFVGPRTLLTAAHCLWIDEFGGWPDGIAIAPGKDAEANPFNFEVVFAESVWVPGNWSETAGLSGARFQWDFGLVTLPSDKLGNTVGSLEIGVLTDATLQRSDFNPTTSGYPGDKPWGTQWTSTQPAFDRVTGTQLINSIDAFQGQSGSGIWGADDGRIVGIVSYETRTTNYALRMTQRVVDGLLGGCFLLRCEFNYSYETVEQMPTPTSEPPPDPTPVPTPTVPSNPLPTPPVTGTSPSPAGYTVPEFIATWERTDRPVRDGAVNRTWMWGVDPGTPVYLEPYLESPGGVRAVTYYDKSRMEITNPNGDPGSIWHVTNGLIVLEMISGDLQLGTDTFEAHQPAQVNVAGDLDDLNGPTYASFNGNLGAPPLAEGAAITHRLNRSGTVTNDQSLANRGVVAARYVPETNHTVASVFWEFMNASGVVYENGGLTTGPLFQNPFYATGMPVSEAYWTTVRVGGTEQDILIQAFERRVLTYTPGNPPGWQVEAGNVGQHYYQWRYVEIPNQ